MPRKTISEHLCPYYFRKCTQKSCTEAPQEPDPVKWKTAVDKLRSCPHSGVELSKKDYTSRQEYIEEKRKEK